MRPLLILLAACAAAKPTPSPVYDTGEPDVETGAEPLELDYTQVWALTSTRDFAGYDVAILPDGDALVDVAGASTVYRAPYEAAVGALRDVASAEIGGDGIYFGLHTSVIMLAGIEYAVLADEYTSPGGVEYAGMTYLVEPSLLVGDVSASEIASYTITGTEEGAYTGPMLVADFDGDGEQDAAVTSASLDAPYLYVFAGGFPSGVISTADADLVVRLLPDGGSSTYAAGGVDVSQDGTRLSWGAAALDDASGVIGVYELPLSAAPEPTAIIGDTSGWVSAWGADGSLYVGSRKRDEVQVLRPDGELLTLTGEDGYGSDIATLTLPDGHEIVAIGEQGTGRIEVVEADTFDVLLSIPLSEDVGLEWCGASVDLRQVGDDVLLAAGCWQEVTGTGTGAILYRLTM